jgi:hypothetical protein
MYLYVFNGHSCLKILEFDKLHISFCIKKFKLKRGWKEKNCVKFTITIDFVHNTPTLHLYQLPKLLTTNIQRKENLANLFMKDDSFFFPITLRSPKPQDIVLLESPWWVGVHQVGFIIFWSTMEKLLNIDQFSR